MTDVAEWSLDADCPPMLAVDYRKAARKVVADG
jgi:hypothetical protein